MTRALALLLAFFCMQAHALSPFDEKMILRATPYVSVFNEARTQVWPDLPMPSFIAAQIEQESFWNPRAELKTAREYGFGFGQLTITSRFNAFSEVKAMSPLLRDWKYDDRFDPRMQIIAVFVKDHANYRNCRPLMVDDFERLACVGVTYNGGYGGFLSDRRLCANTAGCDPTKWFGNVENTSLKSRTKWQGYGQSPFEINRAYARNTMKIRRPKYESIFGR